MKQIFTISNQLTAKLKRLAMVLTMLLIVGIGQAWGATDVILWNGSNPSYQASTTEKTSTDGAITWVNSAGNTYSNPTRIYSGNTLTISVANTNTTQITEIEAVCTSNDYASAFGGTSVSVTGGGTASRSTSGSTTTITITGKATSVAMKMSAQSRVSKLTVTYVTAATTKYTVTLKDDDSTLPQSTAGAAITLPSRDGCDGYTFAGWTNSWKAHQTSWITTAPTIIPAGSYTPTADENLYPVYTKTEGGTPVPATLTASYSSHSGWTATGCGGSSYWVLKQNASITSPVISDLSTVTSITFKVRTYGGSTYNTVNVSTSGGTSIGSATASNTTLTLKTINVSPKLSGSGSIVFSSTTTSSSNGPGINEITINYSTGGSTTYYISVPDCATQTVVYLIPKNSDFWMAHLRLIFGSGVPCRSFAYHSITNSHIKPPPYPNPYQEA